MHANHGYTQSDDFSSWLLYLAPLCFEIAAPMSMLVSTVIKYGIWPRLLQAGGPTKTIQLKSFTNLMEHNVNVIFVFIEAGLIGNLPIYLRHLFMAPLFGMVYVLFSYVMASRWTPGNGPQYLYFFLDTTLGITSTKALFGLFVVLLLFYILFWILDQIMGYSGSLWIRLGIVCSMSTIFCKFRD